MSPNNKLLKFIIGGLFIFAISTSAGIAKTKISYWTHTYDPAVPVNEVMVKEFMKMNPDVEVSYDHVPHAQYEPKLLTAFAAGTAPDVFWAGDWLMPKWIPLGLLDPVDYSFWGVKSYKEFVNLFEKGAMEPYIWHGKVYAAGISEYNTFSVFYHPDDFKQAGIPLPSETKPMSWEEFAKIAEKLNKFDSSGKRLRSGFESVYNVPIWAVLILEPQIRQIGGEIVKDEQPQFNSPQMMKVLNWWYELKKKKVIDPSFIVSIGDDFAHGRLSMTIAGPWFISWVRSINPNIKMSVMPLPVFKGGKRVTTLYSWQWHVASSSRHKKIAWKFAHYVATQPLRWWHKVRYIEPMKGVISKIVKEEPLLKTFEEDFKYGKYEFRSRKYYKLSEILMRTWQRVIMEGMSPEKALKTAQKEAEKA
ncbi:extracellular solute-binding protein [Candidatus Aerophobetes bacterium]|nr:extracellular solute-binding protein [Candidatus Aerophobetes bacterium]